MHPITICAVIGTIFFTSCSGAFSQAPPVDPRKATKPVVARKEQKEKPLTAAVQLPGIPQYTGQTRYVSGYTFDNGNGAGITYCEKWRAKEDPSAIVNWYKSALSSAGWTMLPGGPKSAVVTAMKDANYVTVTANQVLTNDAYKSDVTLQSFQKNP